MEINKEHEYRIRKVITIKINKDLLQAGLRKIKTYYQNFIHVHDFQLHLKNQNISCTKKIFIRLVR